MHQNHLISGDLITSDIQIFVFIPRGCILSCKFAKGKGPNYHPRINAAGCLGSIRPTHFSTVCGMLMTNRVLMGHFKIQCICAQISVTIINVKAGFSVYFKCLNIVTAVDISSSHAHDQVQ